MGLPPTDSPWAKVLIAEFVLTAIFLYVILGTTDDRSPGRNGTSAIGLLHHSSTPPPFRCSSTSVNPARSFGVAVFAGVDALGQVWVFFLAPLAGAAVAGLTYNLLFRKVVRFPSPRADLHTATRARGATGLWAGSAASSGGAGRRNG